MGGGGGEKFNQFDCGRVLFKDLEAVGGGGGEKFNQRSEGGGWCLLIVVVFTYRYPSLHILSLLAVRHPMVASRCTSATRLPIRSRPQPNRCIVTRQVRRSIIIIESFFNTRNPSAEKRFIVQ